jgi:hypothetical protein
MDFEDIGFSRDGWDQNDEIQGRISHTFSLFYGHLNMCNRTCEDGWFYCLSQKSSFQNNCSFFKHFKNMSVS